MPRNTASHGALAPQPTQGLADGHFLGRDGLANKGRVSRAHQGQAGAQGAAGAQLLRQKRPRPGGGEEMGVGDEVEAAAGAGLGHAPPLHPLLVGQEPAEGPVAGGTDEGDNDEVVLIALELVDGPDLHLAALVPMHPVGHLLQLLPQLPDLPPVRRQHRYLGGRRALHQEVPHQLPHPPDLLHVAVQPRDSLGGVRVGPPEHRARQAVQGLQPADDRLVVR